MAKLAPRTQSKVLAYASRRGHRVRYRFATWLRKRVGVDQASTGHLLGAAGAVEAIFTVLALRGQVAPPTINLDNPDPASEGLDLVAPGARPMRIDHAISNGFGFGGVNASVVFRRWA